MSIQEIYSNILFILLFIIFIYIYFVFLYIAITHNISVLRTIDNSLALFLILFCTLCIQLYYYDILKYNEKTKFLSNLIYTIVAILGFSVGFLSFIDIDKEHPMIYFFIACVCILLTPFLYLLFILLILYLSYIDFYRK